MSRLGAAGGLPFTPNVTCSMFQLDLMREIRPAPNWSREILGKGRFWKREWLGLEESKALRILLDSGTLMSHADGRALSLVGGHAGILLRTPSQHKGTR